LNFIYIDFSTFGGKFKALPIKFSLILFGRNCFPAKSFCCPPPHFGKKISFEKYMPPKVNYFGFSFM